jgi:hypothetical protein
MSYNPNGLLADPFPLDLVMDDAVPPSPPVCNPNGFPFVVARLPAAPVMSLMELPYSRTMSPHVRDVFAILQRVSSVPLSR